MRFGFLEKLIGDFISSAPLLIARQIGRQRCSR
jgi:hypothetical protein